MKDNGLKHVLLRHITPRLKRMVIEKRSEGKSFQTMHDEFKKDGYFISEYTMLKILKAEGNYKPLDQHLHLTDEEKEKIVDMRRCRVAICDIGVLLHHSSDIIYRYLQEIGMGEKNKGNHRYFSDSDIDRMVDMRNRGDSYEKIGRHFECTGETIKKRIKVLEEEGRITFNEEDRYEEKYDWRRMEDFEG